MELIGALFVGAGLGLLFGMPIGRLTKSDAPVIVRDWKMRQAAAEVRDWLFTILQAKANPYNQTYIVPKAKIAEMHQALWRGMVEEDGTGRNPRT